LILADRVPLPGRPRVRRGAEGTYLSDGKGFNARIDFTLPSTETLSTYKVVNVASNDALSIRAGPSRDHSIVGSIPPNGRGIRMFGSCVQGWCEINYQGITGWINRRFLGLENSSLERWIPYKTVDIERNDVLNIRSGPSPEGAIIGKIPANTHCILSSDCRSDRWCHVTWGNITGWAHNRYLAQDDDQCR
jgi:uncharacterized protein YraI